MTTTAADSNTKYGKKEGKKKHKLNTMAMNHTELFINKI